MRFGKNVVLHAALLTLLSAGAIHAQQSVTEQTPTTSPAPMTKDEMKVQKKQQKQQEKAANANAKAAKSQAKAKKDQDQAVQAQEKTTPPQN